MKTQLLSLAGMIIGLVALAAGLFADFSDESAAYLVLRIALLIMGTLTFVLHVSYFLPFSNSLQKRSDSKMDGQNLIEDGDILLVDLSEVQVEPVNAPAESGKAEWSIIRYCDNSTGAPRWFQSNPLPFSVPDLQTRLQQWGHTHIHFDRRNPQLYYFDLAFLQAKPFNSPGAPDA